MDEYDEYYDSAKKGERPFSNFNWFASDKIGNIAVLCTAGTGSIPKSVFTNRELYYKSETFFECLKPTSDFISFGNLFEDEEKYVQSGIYCYDFSLEKRVPNFNCGYRKTCEPEKPLKVETLPDDIKSYIVAIKLYLEFKDINKIFPENYFPEVDLV